MPEITAPDWIENQAKPTDGIDILGLRFPVQAISGGLLNGITIASPRIRYLSIRSWIIKSFGESGLPNNDKSFSEFAGRLESALAIGLVLANRSQLYIPGSTRAGNIIDEETDSISIERLIDQAGFIVYAGPSYDLYLSYSNQNSAPGLTKERGEPLAVQFETLIKPTRFYSLLKENPLFNSVSREVLKELGEAINLEQLPDQERDLILDALIPTKPIEKDSIPLRKEVMRVAFYALVLELANTLQRAPTETDVFSEALKAKLELAECLIPVLDGYLMYRMRDMIAVIHEAVLGDVTSELGGYDGVVDSTHVISALLGDTVGNTLRSLGLLTAEESFESLRFLDLVGRVEKIIGERTLIRGLYRWDSDLDENKIVGIVMKNKMAAIGLQPVAWILSQCRVGAYDQTLLPELEILSRQGSARLGLQQVILPQLKEWSIENPTLDQVIAWQIQRSVDQHLRIAWSRMFTDITKDVAVLISDGDNWQHRNKNFAGDRTASRISQSIGWLRQLKLIDTNGISASGEAVLQRCYQVLATDGGAQ